MAETRIRTRRTWLIVGGCLLAVVAVVLGVAGRGEEDKPESLLPEELSADSLKAQAAEDPSKLGEVLERHNPEEMTDEQRRELRRNTREAFRSVMNSRMEEYFAAAEEERQAILDRHIDEFRKRMAEWRKRREGREDREERDRSRFRDMFRSRTREERKADSENRNPDEMARGMAYFMAIRQRMSERGIEMSWGPGGGHGRGGRGGSRGMGGGGRGPGH
jgi:pyruvate/2-oxoglutarate dehydrogenase complex dihydrolipoamide acyltransferase (E2) component